MTVDAPSATRVAGATRKPRLAVFVFVPLHLRAGRYTTEATFQHMLDAFLPAFSRLDLVAPVVAGGQAREQVSDRLHVIPLPGFTSGRERYLTRLPRMLAAVTSTFLRHRREWDLVWIVDTEVESQLVAALAFATRQPAFVYVRGREDLQTLKAGMRRGWRRLAGGVYGSSIRLAAAVMARALPVVVTGSELEQIFGASPRRHRFVSTLVRQADLAEPQAAGTDILCVGRVAPVKGLATAVRALALAKGTAIRLRVVGPAVPAHQEELEGLAAELGVAGRVEFRGPVPFGDQLRAEYRSAGVYLHPALSEGTPKSLLEAMAAGLPVVASRVGSIPELVDESCAILVDPGDAAAVAAGLDRLAADPRLRKRMGAAARRRAGHYVLEAQAAELVDFLERVHPAVFAR